ncbi:MAG TPA: hypothetical protein VKK79_17510 [Candidatus Lokiarchaeia archaeon]|nr:hypothetical protein [Candidatus Lokiarchaeia archaeon]
MKTRPTIDQIVSFNFGDYSIIVTLPSFLFILYSFIVATRLYRQAKLRPFLLLAVMAFTWACWGFISMLYYAIWDPSLQLIADAVMPICIIIIILWLDSLSRESIDPVKSGTLLCFVTAFFMAGLLGFPVIDTAIFYACAIWGVSLFAYFALKIYRNAPSGIKRKAAMLATGSIIGGPVMAISEIFNTYSGSFFIPSPAAIFVPLGLLLVTRAFATCQELAFVLPFKVSHLTVLSTKSGVPLFTHAWTKDEDRINDTLFSGMLQGISGILNEAVHKGNVRQIELDQGVLLVQRSDQYPVACVLVANKSTRLLRQSLDSFARRFFAEFAPFFAEISIVANFNPAEQIIAETMPFIPDYS